MTTADRRARFLLAMIDAGGTVPPALGLAGDLIRRGHQVQVLADPTIETSARSAGCGFTPWRDAPHFNSRAEQTAMIAAMEGRNPVRAVQAVKAYAGKDMTSRFAGDVVATVRDSPVDVILADGLPGILIGAQSTGLPTAALLAQTYLRPTPGLPLPGTGWSPARSFPPFSFEAQKCFNTTSTRWTAQCPPTSPPSPSTPTTRCGRTNSSSA